MDKFEHKIEEGAICIASLRDMRDADLKEVWCKLCAKTITEDDMYAETVSMAEWVDMVWTEILRRPDKSRRWLLDFKPSKRVNRTSSATVHESSYLNRKLRLKPFEE